jgi:hypothetical protein
VVSDKIRRITITILQELGRRRSNGFVFEKITIVVVVSFDLVLSFSKDANELTRLALA